MPEGVSVIICCHNSAQRLPETLRHLAAQEVRPGLAWEVVVIDNASKDDTAATAERCWPSSAPAKLRVVVEPEAGLSHARIRGIHEARYDLISFIDDDNWAAVDWIERVQAHFSAQTDLGACGGRLEAVCEITAPPWFQSVRGFYAGRPQYPKSGDITDEPGTLLCGAGLSLRATAVRKLLRDGFVFKMSDRKGKHLSSGGDTELCLALRASGWRFWYDDTLLLQHFIPRARLQWAYALGLMRGMGQSATVITLYLLALGGAPFDEYPDWKRSWLFQFGKTLCQLISTFASGPADCVGRREGSLAALEWERVTSELGALWELRGQYTNLQKEIRSSAWIKRER